MKWLSKLIVGVLLVVLSVLVLYGAYRFLLPHWFPILFWGYIVGYLVLIPLGILQTIQEKKNANEHQTTLVLLKQVNAPAKFMVRARNVISAVLRIASDAFLWPVNMTIAIGLNKKRGGSATTINQLALMKESGAFEPYGALYCLVLVVAILTLSHFNVDLGRYGRISIIVILTCVLLRDLRYVVSNDSLPVLLRRGSEKPYRSFLTIFFADTAVSVLVFTALHSDRIGNISLANAKSTLLSLYELRDIVDDIRHFEPSPQRIGLAIASVLLAAVFVETLLHFKEFKRDDEDYLWMASVSNELGEFTRSLKYLSKIEKWGKEERMTNAVALIGVGEIVEAENQVKAFLEASKNEISPDRVFMIEGTACTFAEASADVRARIFERAVANGVRDVVFTSSIVIFGRGDEIRLRLQQILDQHPGAFPITAAILLVMEEKFDEAAAKIAGVKTSSSTEEIVRRITALSISVMNPATSLDGKRDAFNTWANDNLQEIAELVKTVEAPLDCIIVFTQLNDVRVYADALAKDRSQQIIYLADQVRSKAPAEQKDMEVIQLRYDRTTRGN